MQRRPKPAVSSVTKQSRSLKRLKPKKSNRRGLQFRRAATCPPATSTDRPTRPVTMTAQARASRRAAPRTRKPRRVSSRSRTSPASARTAAVAVAMALRHRPPWQQLQQAATRPLFWPPLVVLNAGRSWLRSPTAWYLRSVRSIQAVRESESDSMLRPNHSAWI